LDSGAARDQFPIFIKIHNAWGIAIIVYSRFRAAMRGKRSNGLSCVRARAREITLDPDRSEIKLAFAMKREQRRKQNRAILHGMIAREFSRRIPRQVAASFHALLYLPPYLVIFTTATLQHP